MTAATARAARTGAAPKNPARRTPAARPRPQLRAVPAPPWRAPLAPFVIVAVALVVAGLLALLMLNTLVAEDSFRVRQLEQETTRLREQEQVLLAEVARLDAPAVLARKAVRDLGMVPAGSPAFILPDGKILGDPGRPAVATPPTRPVTAPVPKTVKPVKKAKKSPAQRSGKAKPPPPEEPE